MSHIPVVVRMLIIIDKDDDMNDWNNDEVKCVVNSESYAILQKTCLHVIAA